MSEKPSSSDFIRTDLSDDRQILLLLDELQRKLEGGDPTLLRAYLRKSLADFVTVRGYTAERHDRYVFCLDT